MDGISFTLCRAGQSLKLGGRRTCKTTTKNFLKVGKVFKGCKVEHSTSPLSLNNFDSFNVTLKKLKHLMMFSQE